MLVTTDSNKSLSILNTPTLARVERARIRNETTKTHREDSLVKQLLDPKHSILAKKLPINCISGPIKRGLLWQQRDRLFSRWKERYFVLTLDYLHCFKRASASERISDMGQFIFKVKLFDVEKVEWLNRRSYSAISLYLGSRESRILLRCDHCLEDWYELLEECILNSKQRRQALRNIQGLRSRASIAAPPSHSSLQRNIGGAYSSAIEDCLSSRYKTSNSMVQFLLSDSVPDLTDFNEFNGLAQNQSIQQIYRNKNDLQYSINSNGASVGSCDITNGINVKDDHDIDNEVQLRNVRHYENGNGKDWLMYRKPLSPNIVRNSSGTEPDMLHCDNRLYEHRPASYRDVLYTNTSDTKMDYSSRSTLVSQDNSYRPNANSLRYKMQTKNVHDSNEENKHSLRSNINELYDSNQNRYYSTNENINNSNRISESIVNREKYRQHPAFMAIINDCHGNKFRDRAFSDSQHAPHRKLNNNSPNARRRPLIEAAT